MQHIVIVEDDPIQIKILKMILSTQNYRVSFYAQAEELMQHIHELEANLFLLDLALPDMDGFTLCQHIRAIRSFRHTPIVAVSADVSFETKTCSSSSGFTDLIEKPIRINEFLKAIESYFLPA